MGIPQRKSSMNVQMPKKISWDLPLVLGAMPTKPEAEIAKNYLTQDEIKSLNRIVKLIFSTLQKCRQKSIAQCI